MSNTILKLDNLTVSYGSIKALKGINIKVREGEIVALLGANGAGKTTTLKTLSGIVPAENGSIEFCGKNIVNMAPEKITALGIVQSPEGRQIFPDITVEENLRVGAFTVKSKKEIAQEILDKYEYVYEDEGLLVKTNGAEGLEKYFIVEHA